ncbi:MAG TPA: sugar ABC transporter permease [Candidatus Kapabacteria bacterium]|nr:sugar ABC transporter permease [Candidatus Kapabacteria bacterium]
MRKRLSRSIIPYLYLAPVLIGLSVFTIGPILSSFFLSFTDYELGLKATWIGAENYAKLGESEVFLQSVKNTLLYVVLYVPLAVAFSFTLAMLVNGKLRARAFFRTVFFLPVVTSMVAAALIWGWLYHPDVGLLNYVLSSLGIVGPRWLEDPDTALSALVIVGVWKNAGYNMLIFLAGLSGISNEVIEAARLEGASVWQRTRHVIVPMLLPVIFFVTVITTISAFQIFEQTYVLTKGGPANSTLTLSYYIWQMAFQFFDMGLASAMAYVLFAILAVLTVVQFQVRKRAAA